MTDDGEPYADSVLPDGCVDIVWDGQRLFIAGPDTGPGPIARDPGSFFVGIRFRPGLALNFLGVATSELLDLRVDAVDVLGNLVEPLAERLHDAASLRAAALELESALLERLPDAMLQDRLLEAAVAALETVRWRARCLLAQQLGVSERQLHRRCTIGVGYGPTMLHRVLRFRRFLACPVTVLGLARLAVEVGYADQAHLTRDSRRLAGVPPTALVPSTGYDRERPIRSRRSP